MKIGNGDFWLGDCLELMARIPDGSVDMVLCDLPYGTTQNKWDAVIPFEPLWAHYWRVCKPNAAVVLTGAQPFTSALVMSQVQHFKYDWTWEKAQPSGHLNAKKMPLRAHEDVLVFARNQPVYNPQKTDGHPRVRATHHRQSSNYGTQITGQAYDSTERYPRSVQLIRGVPNSNGSKIHPTQKPVALFDYLIRTYTNPGDLVLDNCAGSGTTAIAAEQTGRRWLCIERDPGYYYGAIGRVAAHQSPAR